jgi:hypothetical protein
MHSPAHAAGEIGRLMKAVRGDRMPLDETGIEQPLEPALKRPLLERGSALEGPRRTGKPRSANRRSRVAGFTVVFLSTLQVSANADSSNCDQVRLRNEAS